MKKRIITAVVAIAVVIALLVFKDTVAVCIALTVLGAVAATEIHKVSRNDNMLLYVASIVYLAVCPYIVRGYIPMNYLTLTALYFIAFALGSLREYTEHGRLENQFLNALMAIFVSFGFAAILRLLDNKFGIFYFFVAGISAWITDTGAYFVGTLFGKHKLAPILSPKKTVEGAVGGVIFCILVEVGFALLYTGCFVKDASVNYFALIPASLLASCGGMVGDLFASAVKRFYGVKDYGNFFPGHGGVIDRVDSALFSFPIVLIFSEYIALIA